MSRYASLYAEQCHADLVLARDVIQRASRELAELIEGNTTYRPKLAAALEQLITDVVEDHIPHEMFAAAEQYDDANPLRVAA